MENKSKKILTEISAGELLDKISILEIKLDNIKDKVSLIEINMKLWTIENEKRICEKNKDFGKKFIELARKVYFNNDKRSKIKSEVNKILMSNINEVKEYVQY